VRRLPGPTPRPGGDARLLCRRPAPGHRQGVFYSVRAAPSRPVVEVLPHLDGLRGVAVLFVLLYHARVGFHGGYVGVDVFLVLSGFLVTSLLLTEYDSGGVSLPGFWSRRVRRLLPVSTLVVAVTTLAGIFLLEPQRLGRLAGDVFGVATFSANVRFHGTHGDYLGGLSLPSPLLHFWSLALEEQFYVLWPILLVAVLRSARRTGYPKQVLVALTALLAAASFALSVTLTSTRSAFSYYLLPTRAWELLAGALLALCWGRFAGFSAPTITASSVGEWARSVLGALGLLALVLAGAFFDASTVFPGWVAVLPVSGTLAVLLAGSTSVSGRILSTASLRWLGVRSYGAYLWHWPLLVFAGALGWDGSPWSRLVVVGVSVGLADVSLRVIESPVRASAWFAVSLRRTALLGGGLTVPLLGLALLVQSIAVVPVAGVSGGASLPSRQVVPDRVEGVAPVEDFPSMLDSADLPFGAKVLLLGDSTLAPLRWFVDGGRGLESAGSHVEFVLDAESCRRLSLRSCRGREARTPDTAVEALMAWGSTGERFRFVVLMAGYHSSSEEFESELDAFMHAAGEHGVEKVFVLEYRESLAFPLDGSRGRTSVFAKFNDVLRARAVAKSGNRYDAAPELVVLRWNAFSANAVDWFRSDGIHVNLAGALGLGEFIAHGVLSDLGLPCGSSSACRSLEEPLAATDVLAAYDLVPTDEHCYEMGDGRSRKCRPDKLR